jgi:hypothetical protein
MTDLEDRVRDALLARAVEFTTSPDAWARTKARAGRRSILRRAHRPGRQRWRTRFTPLAAAAAVIAIAAGSAVLAVNLGHGGSPAPQATTSPGGRATTSPGGRLGGPKIPCAFPNEPKTVQRYVVGVQISAKVTTDGVTAWWTRIPEDSYPQVKTDLALCQTHDGGGTGSPELPLARGQLVRVDDHYDNLGYGVSTNGIAVASVASVDAVLANGSVVRGGLANGRGFPYAVWWVTYPQGIAATLVFRDAAGQAVARVAEPYPPASSLKHPAPLPPPYGGSPAHLCDEARVQQVADGTKVWTYVGFTDPGSPTPTLCEVTGIVGAEADYTGVYTVAAGQVVRPVMVLYPTSSMSGTAVPGVTSVTAVLADGKKYTGTIITGKVFADPVWLVSYPLKDPATLVFRNAAGTQVAVLREPANP